MSSSGAERGELSATCVAVHLAVVACLAGRPVRECGRARAGRALPRAPDRQRVRRADRSTARRRRADARGVTFSAEYIPGLLDQLRPDDDSPPQVPPADFRDAGPRRTPTSAGRSSPATPISLAPASPGRSSPAAPSSGAAQFSGGAFFAEAEFSGGAFFAEAEFSGGADVGGAQFSGGADVGFQDSGVQTRVRTVSPAARSSTSAPRRTRRRAAAGRRDLQRRHGDQRDRRARTRSHPRRQEEARLRLLADRQVARSHGTHPYHRNRRRPQTRTGPRPGSRMPAVKNVGEPCAGEPLARIDAAAGGNERQSGFHSRAAWAPPPTLPIECCCVEDVATRVYCADRAPISSTTIARVPPAP